MKTITLKVSAQINGGEYEVSRDYENNGSVDFGAAIESMIDTLRIISE